jgi:hypothetical protein
MTYAQQIQGGQQIYLLINRPASWNLLENRTFRTEPH